MDSGRSFDPALYHIFLIKISVKWLSCVLQPSKWLHKSLSLCTAAKPGTIQEGPLSVRGDRGATQLSLHCGLGWVKVGSPPCPQSTLGRTCSPQSGITGVVLCETHIGTGFASPWKSLSGKCGYTSISGWSTPPWPIACPCVCVSSSPFLL